MEGVWTVAGALDACARAHPARTALHGDDHQVTWGEFRLEANRLARAMIERGVGRGDRVAVLDRNGIDHLVILYAAAKLGTVYTPVNWRLAPGEIADVLADACPSLLFLGGELAPCRVAVEGLDPSPAVIDIGDGDGELRRRWAAGHPDQDPVGDPGPADVVLQLYTSGTTGRAKGVMLTNANVGALVEGTRKLWGFDPASVNAVTSPLFHIGGCGWAVAGLVGGGAAVIFRDLDPGRLVAGIRARGVTHAFVVPALIQAMLDVPGVGSGGLGSLRNLYYGASPISESLLGRALEAFGPNLLQLYGMTETTGAITQLPRADHDPLGPRRHLLRSAGRAFPWVELKVVDPVTGIERGPEEIGEVWTRSDQNMSGYWRNPEATEAAITADGWLRTGDGGYLDADGYLFLADRVKDMIVSGGENVYPVEVENVLAAHPDIADVAVIGVPDDRWGETVKAIVVLRPGCAGDGAAIINFARSRLAHFKCPTSVAFAPTLPRNPTGKVLKRELRETYARRT